MDLLNLKSYHGHEFEYQRMRQQGIASWDLRDKKWDIDPADRTFVGDVLSNEWCPQSGRILELGCGTGPWLRWFSKKGFQGLGIDISETAIQMAREQSEGYPVEFRRGDVCREQFSDANDFDLCLDGHLMHCICDPDDRNKVLYNVSAALKADGVFILMSMCSPIDEVAFANSFPRQFVMNEKIFCPASPETDYDDLLRINGREYMPTRYLAHRHSLLNEIQSAGFCCKMVSFTEASAEDPVGTVRVAAVKSR